MHTLSRCTAPSSSSSAAGAVQQSSPDKTTVSTNTNSNNTLSNVTASSLREQPTSDSQEDLMVPLMLSSTPTTNKPVAVVQDPVVRSRRPRDKRRRRRNDGAAAFATSNSNKRMRCCHSPIVRMMNVMARILFWVSLVCLAAGVVWYSYELTKHGTDPHLIAWFSAGAFVLLGFPISMYGIVMHLANYNQPNVQCYVVRILWMVPIYSMESWLCLRFHRYAIYIETLRDVYESYVLYCFLQFLIQVLGGQDELVQILRTKSPTRGVHMWGLQWCVRPWLMGQPVSRTLQGNLQWTSPFFVKAKFGVLQYVLLKFCSSILVMILELNGIYKEGDFTPKGGYLYICILTNLSQCWALYCLIFFYYATKNELGPIRPVGKFLSVKALVFFTWWQSFGISVLYQMDMIPHYHAKEEWTSEDVAKGLQDYLICIEMFLAAIVHVFVFPHTDYLAVPVRRGMLASPQKRLGRKHLAAAWRDDKSVGSKNSGYDHYDLELASAHASHGSEHEQHQERLVETATSPLPPANNDEDDSSETSQDDEEVAKPPQRKGFVSALLDSTIPRDVMDNTVGIVKGDYVVEKKTLLHHAATSDQYDLFRASRFHTAKKPPSL